MFMAPTHFSFRSLSSLLGVVGYMSLPAACPQATDEDLGLGGGRSEARDLGHTSSIFSAGL